ncbi:MULTISPECIES: rhodanese-like domain-containing protein [Bacillales]|uniref:rhodanese-like domain-containing protein n=1 Tax=Bacillales TaxID=1385 RepID=UPI0003F76DD2|nr:MULTISPECIES: rhodanese-like domain-containing protein [Bacillales]MDN4094596.1 rhodanese-like domain-containing protein [Brevibacillus agri]MED0677505.1 rhodanese-like domain-containing protein [Aneurinibacillus thermoaerophilus]MED3500526.1 rhodanese-like domain-containing protein [Brevibacillus agri]
METSTLINILVWILLGWFVYSRFAPIQGVKNIKADELSKQFTNNSKKVIIDVREPREYENGYIPGAINIPLSQIKGRMKDIPTDKDIFLYCQSGMRSKQAARILTKGGFKNLFNLQGGIMAWGGKIQTPSKL